MKTLKDAQEVIRIASKRQNLDCSIKQLSSLVGHGYVVVAGLTERKTSVKAQFDIDEELVVFMVDWLRRKERTAIQQLKELGVEDTSLDAPLEAAAKDSND